MKKMLIAIANNENNLQARSATRYLVDALNLCHTNIEQQVIDAAAAALRLSPHEFTVALDHFKKIPVLNINAIELKQKIRASLCAQNPYFLIDSLHEFLQQKNPYIKKLFNGNIISGISNNTEADYIRSQGGLVLHIENSHSNIESPIAHKNNDLAIHTSNQEPLCVLTLQAFAKAIAAHFEESAAAQANTEAEAA